MKTWDVRLLSASYIQNDEDVSIELFGKTREGKSITVLAHGFRPYFFIVDPTPEIESKLKKDREVLSTEHDSLLFRGEYHDMLKVTIMYPYKVPEYRNNIKNEGFKILSADIPFHLRYIYDMDLGACLRVNGKEISGTYTTDLIVDMENHEDIEPFTPPMRVMSFDLENSIEHEYIYCICAVISENNVIRECEPITGSEKEIITKFAELIKKEDPDVLTGYNIDNYDIKKIKERADVNKLTDAMPWGRDGGQVRSVSDRFWRIKGRLVIDAWWAAKKELRPKQETLNAVSMQLLGEGKMDVNPAEMDAEWRDNREKVLEYCTKDAELALRILDNIDSLRKGMDLAAVSRLPAEDVLSSGSSQLVDSLLIRAADRRKVAVPTMGGRGAKDDQIEGGYVHTMNAGLYHWVVVLDFKSMYPSLIISKNICFTTLSEDGEIISPAGARFMSKERREGLLPAILSNLMDYRDSIKTSMKLTTDTHEHHYLDGLQEAVKIIMNTFYGVFASSFYRFTNKNIGAAITSFARANVKHIINELESEKIGVIYSDTDSVFIQSPANNLEESVEFGKSLAERFTTEGGVLEFEKLIEPLFSHGKKKRYVGRVVWPNKEDDLLVRGYEIRRSDSFGIQSKLLEELFEEILNEETEKAIVYARQTIQDTLNGKISAEELVISRSCKGLNAYANPDRMTNVQAARKMMALGYKFIPGMKVSWIVTNGSITPQKVEPYISGKEFKHKPDYRYYAERLAHTVSRITEVFGWSERDLMMGSQQKTLFDMDFQSKPSEKPQVVSKPKPEVKKKTSSLNDFF
ncbi:MAG TPA: DNA polymerase domain-containing protein [Candidatus Methanomethylophilaceae archaeon]|nr:DNA polymerase domain-containing protein [Candidatus Methanomethylophilaceae archaeon]